MVSKRGLVVNIIAIAISLGLLIVSIASMVSLAMYSILCREVRIFCYIVFIEFLTGPAVSIGAVVYVQ